MNKPSYSLIIPAHNEAARLGRTLGGYLDAFADSEVLLVLNGCTDETESVALTAANGRTNLRILRIDHAVGKGGAVRAGFLEAKAPIIGYVDADGATSPQEIRRLFDSLTENDDAVIASRWSKGAEVVVAQPAMRRLSSRIFNAIVKLLFDLPFHDTQCGAKVFSSAAIQRISHALEVANFAFDIDLLYGLKRKGYRIREIPTVWHDVLGSRINLPRASIEMLSAVFRLRLRHSLFRYVVPLLDRLLPTTTLRVRYGLSVLIVDPRDPSHASATGMERYLHEVGRRLVEGGHRVQWLTSRSAGARASETADGMGVRRIGNRLTSHLLIPLTYLREFRDQFDVIVDVTHGFPMFSSLFSLKPKIRMAAAGAWIAPRFSASSYANTRFVVLSKDAARKLARLGISENGIDVIEPGVMRNEWDMVAARFLNAIFRAVSYDHASYVRCGTAWSILPHRRRLADKVQSTEEEYRTGTFFG